MAKKAIAKKKKAVAPTIDAEIQEDVPNIPEEDAEEDAEEIQEAGDPRAAEIGWKNHGAPFHVTINGKRRIIKPNETYKALPSEIPKAFRDTQIPTEALKEESGPNVVKAGYYMKKRANSNFYDILNNKGRVISQKPLTKAEAQEILDDLMGD